MAAEFAKYLGFVSSDRRYAEVRSLYTSTDAVRLELEAQAWKREKSDDRHKEAEKEPPEPVIGLLKRLALGDEPEHVLLAGRPGSGKSTALRQLLLELVEAAQADESQPIPVLVQLKGSSPILEAITSELEKGDLEFEPKEIKRLLRHKRLILLLDGVNEIPNGALRRELQEFRDRYSDVPMIFTTRDSSVGGTVHRLEMQPLSKLQMLELAQNYLAQPDVSGQAEKLLGQLSGGLREVAETPLLLKMLCDVFDPKMQQIPQSKGELFQWFDRDYERIKKDTEYVPVSENFWLFKKEVLQYLAFSTIRGDLDNPTNAWYSFSCEHVTNILEMWLCERGIVDAPTKAKLWIQDLLNFHLLQEAAEPGEIEFHHQLFQEYYAAEWLLKRIGKIDDHVLKQEYLNYLKWTESFALITGLPKCHSTTSSRLVELALQTDPSLGARIIKEMKVTLQQQSVDLLLGKGFSTCLTILLLEQSRSCYALPFLLKVLKEGVQDTRWRAARALGNFEVSIVQTPLILALADPHSSVRHKAAESLAKLQIEEAVPEVCKLLHDNEWIVRTFVIDSIGSLAKHYEYATGCLKQALSHKDYSVRNKAAQYLHQYTSEDVIELLAKELEVASKDRKKQLLTLLCKTRSYQAVSTLRKYLFEKDWTVRSRAAGEISHVGIMLGYWSVYEAIPDFLYLLRNDSEVIVRSSVALHLGVIGNERAVEPLKSALNNDTSDLVRSVAARSLGQLQAESAIPDLLTALRTSQDERICENALRSLSILKARESLPLARKLTKSKKSMVLRREAILCLGDIGKSEDFSYLYRALKDKSFNVRLNAAHALSQRGNRKGIPILENALRTGNKDACQLALRSLITFSGKVGFTSILSTAFDEEYSISKIALRFLSGFRDRKEVKAKIKAALHSTDESICRKGMDVAKELGSPEHLMRLRHLAERITVVERPMEAIAAIQARCKFYSYEIFCSSSAQTEPSKENTLARIKEDTQNIKKEIKLMAERPSFQIASISGGINNFTPNQGTQHLTQIDTQNNYFGVDDDLRQHVEELHKFITELEAKHPNVQTQAEAESIREKAIANIQTTNPSRWKIIRQQMRLLKRAVVNPERHLQAGKATLVEVAKKWYDKSLIATAIITYIDKLSETPGQGE